MAQFDDVQFPGWEVTKKLGVGSFGGVYEIRRTLPDGKEERAALKKMTVPQDENEIEEMQLRSLNADSITDYYKNQMSDLVSEYSLMQSLSGCPNIVCCHDIRYVQHEDNIGWDIYIRMELLRPLKKALGGGYSEEMTCKLGIQLCNALIACHEENILHRDIKPENILVSDKGVFKLGDFGIAKVSERTTTGTMIGTYGYMAPEVANRLHYGTAADIYSLGMVLYWLMNRRTLPFLPLPPAIPSAVQRQEAQNRRFSGEALPAPADGSRELKRIVLKACAFRPEDRYQPAQELHEALSACLPGDSPRPAPRDEPTILDECTRHGGLVLPAPPAAGENAPGQRQSANAPRPAPEQRESANERKPAQGRQEYAQKPVLPREAPARRRKRRAGWIPLLLLLLCGIAAGTYLTVNGIRATRYQAAQSLMAEGNFSDAAEAFEALGTYNDSAEQAKEARVQLDLQQKEEAYQAAQSLMDKASYQEAAEAFEALGTYSNSAEKAKEALRLLSLREGYQSAQALLDAESYKEAAEAFEALGTYSNSTEKAEEARVQLDLQQKEQAYQSAQNLLDSGKYMQAMWAFSDLDYRDSAEKAQAARTRYLSAQSATIAAGTYHTVGLHADGTVVTTGSNGYGQRDVSDWKDIVAIAAGERHTVGLRSDDTVVTTGSNDYGQCDVSGWKDIVAIAAGGNHTVGLRADGTVVAVGSNSFGQCDVSGWKDIVAIAAGGWHTVGLHADGTVVTTGSNGYGQCNVSGWKDIVAIAARADHTVGLRADGTVVAVGYNGYGQCDVSGWKDIVAIAAGDYHTVGLCADGAVVAVGNNWSGQCDVSGWKDIVAIAAGWRHTVGLRSDGTVVAVGYNGAWQCDVSGWKNIRLPQTGAY